MSNSRSKKNKKAKLKVVLLFGWVIFIALIVGYYFLFMRTKDDTTEVTEEVTTKYTYQTNANMDINALVVNYLGALTTCDQTTLQASVTNPEAFDDMSIYQSKATIITNYSNVNCYTIQGYSEDATIVYAISNISITDVTSTPLDIIRLYVKQKDGKYYIDNGELTAEESSFIDSIDAMQDMQDLYRMVKEDIDKCLSEDSTFKAFYEKIAQ